MITCEWAKQKQIDTLSSNALLPSRSTYCFTQLFYKNVAELHQ